MGEEPTKTCSKCAQEKPLDQFAPTRNVCTSCRSAQDRAYRKANHERLKGARRAYYDATTDHRKDYHRKYRAKHAATLSANKKRWREDNLDKVRTGKRKWARGAGKLPIYLRTRMRLAIRTGQRAGSAVRDLGCTIVELRAHLESLFQPGMTWENWGAWHIDHKKPLASFDLTNREDFLRACHFTNLQPLWAADNALKGAAF